MALGIAIWKQRRIRDFLTAVHGVAPAFRSTATGAVRAALRRDGLIVVWATRQPPDLAPLAAAAGVRIVRLEDGFIRSVGLGADFTPGQSFVLDGRGIYYDPTGLSDLDALLEGASFANELLARAKALTARIVSQGVTKYNVGSGVFRSAAPPGVQKVFVPGQVEDDQSVRLGGGGISRNIDLLAAVRRARPEGWLIYKPHPDVEAGHRLGAEPDDAVRVHADEIVRDVSTAAIMAEVDEVHALTSLCGFEALLRGLAVTTYGRPFYAGWGLTTDRGPPLRRARALSIDALAAGVLILYPFYFDARSRRLCAPEDLIARLQDEKLRRPSGLVRLRRLQGRVWPARRP